MCKNIISKKVHDFLLNHIAYIEREKDMLIKQYYSEETQECINFEDFFKNYKSTIVNFLDNSTIDKNGITTCPFVLVDSIVDVYDLEDMESYSYNIVLPYKKQDESNVDSASCLSPLGKALLFKKINEKAQISIPTGVLHYRIEKISFSQKDEENNITPLKAFTLQMNSLS
ncbi:UNVERIFIED_CONTAM: transcription elongation factor GreA [Acetivibrio alkalicellulosi]